MACSFSFISFTKLATWARHESGPAPGSDLGQAFIPSCPAWAQEGLELREVSGVRAVSSRRLLCQVQQCTAPREGCRHLGVGAGISEPIWSECNHCTSEYCHVEAMGMVMMMTDYRL